MALQLLLKGPDPLRVGTVLVGHIPQHQRSISMQVFMAHEVDLPVNGKRAGNRGNGGDELQTTSPFRRLPPEPAADDLLL